MSIKTILAFGVALALSAAARAGDISYVVTPSVVSQYMFRGVRLGGPALQPSVEVDSGNLAVGVWASTPLADKVPGQSDPEIDPYASYTFTVNNSLNISPGVTWYNYPRAKTQDGSFRSTFEPNVALNYTLAGVRLTPKLYYDIVLKGPTYELSLACATPLKSIGSELDWTATGGTYIISNSIKDADPEVKNWGNYWLVGVSAPFTITKASKLVIGFAYTKGSGNAYKQDGLPQVDNTSAVGRGVVSVSYSYTF